MTITLDSPEAGARLFKYRTLSGAKELKYVLDILMQHRLHVSPPKSFNDPFDCRGHWSFDGTEEQKLDRVLKRILLEKPRISAQDARLEAPKRIGIVERDGRKNIETLIETQIGVVSFSGSPDDLLLWAHYADSHRGIVIEFDANKLAGRLFRPNFLNSHNFFGMAQRVQYADTLPVINFYTDKIERQAEKLILTKSIHWQYEQEWRMIIMDRRVSPHLAFEPEYITAIYLGCRVEDANRKAILNCLTGRNPTIPVFDAKPSTAKYRLDFVPVL